MHEGRVSWSSHVGFIMAAAGSAVGLGNLWKFPYMTWNNNGGAFVLVYLLTVMLIGLPIMVAEILVGRRAQLSPAPAFERLGSKRWALIGWLGVAASAVIQAYYMVIAGWSVRSFFQCCAWSISGYKQPQVQDFDKFLANGSLQIALTALFTIATCYIVYRGVSAGIEKASKIMMPTLFLILLYLVATSLLLPGHSVALDKMLVPRFGTLPLRGVLDAVGQAFFSLSLGLGAMITYGSYLSKEASIPKASLAVVVFDTLIALLACTAMFSIVYSVPGMTDRISASAVGMLFITLPNIFYTTMPGGIVLGPLFFVLVGFAALTSTISLAEVMVSLCIDKFKWGRRKAVVITTLVVFVGSVLAALSLGASETLSSFEVFAGKKGVLSTLDHLAANWMLPLGGLGTTIFVGWFLGSKACMQELGIKKPSWLFVTWIWLLRIVAPVAIAAILIAVMLGKDFS